MRIKKLGIKHLDRSFFNYYSTLKKVSLEMELFKSDTGKHRADEFYDKDQ